MTRRLLAAVCLALGALAPAAAASELPQQADWGTDSASRQAPAGNGDRAGGGGSAVVGPGPARGAMDSGSAASASGSGFVVGLSGATVRGGQLVLRVSCSSRCRVFATVRAEDGTGQTGRRAATAGRGASTLRVPAPKTGPGAGLRLALHAVSADGAATSRLVVRGL